MAAALLSICPIFAAFEGVLLFQPLYYSPTSSSPLSISTAARLPGAPVWAAVGRGNLLGQPWAAYNTVTVGGRWGSWRGSGTVWSAGDELYRESMGIVSVGRPIGQNLVGGVSLAQAWIQIKAAPVVEPQNVFGLSATGKLGKGVAFSLSYDGLSIGNGAAVQNFIRQQYRLGLHSNTVGWLGWALAVDKTPGFALRYGAGVQLNLLRNVSVDAGYRTNPAMPHFSAQFRLGRVALTVRVINHTIFGISKGFGLSFK